ncbi:MAG: hypothetical protein QM522_09660, partial [Chitinophagaceae bacterium]|nr:hypothetical protein [Chitinophagaceae bacterium]
LESSLTDIGVGAEPVWSGASLTAEMLKVNVRSTRSRSDAPYLTPPLSWTWNVNELELIPLWLRAGWNLRLEMSLA